MKKYISIVLVLICFVTNGQNQQKIERLKALRIAYISNKLELTTNEAEKFWPVFNAFDEQQSEIRLQKRILMMKLRNSKNSNKSDKEMTALLDESEKIDGDLQTTRRNFVKNLQGIISPKKIMMLKQIEDNFKMELLRKIKQRNGSEEKN
jgi:hypothetical protein